MEEGQDLADKAISYKNIGLRIGLEIHRQINSKKLFCRCPSTLTEEKPDFILQRRLRPIISELGERDIAAEYEASKKCNYRKCDLGICKKITLLEPTVFPWSATAPRHSLITGF